MEIDLIKAPGGFLKPSLPEDEDKLKRIATGEIARVKLKVIRNAKYHRKFFAMVTYAYDCWEPHPVLWKGERVNKNFERFRKDLLIMAGHSETSYGLDGRVHVQAKSIAWSRIKTDHEFEKIYNPVAQVILDRVLSRYDHEDLDAAVNRMLGFI